MGLSQTKYQQAEDMASGGDGFRPAKRRTRASSCRTTRVSMGLIERKPISVRPRRKSESETESEVTFKKDNNYSTFCSDVIRHSKRTIRSMTRSDDHLSGIEEERSMLKKITTLTEELHKNEEEISVLYDCLKKKEEDLQVAKLEMTETIQAQTEEITHLQKQAGKLDDAHIPQCFISDGQELEALTQTKSLSRGKGSFASCVPFIYRGTQVCVKSFFAGKGGITYEEAEKNMLHEASILLTLKDNAGLPKLILVVMESANKLINSTSLVLSYHGMDGQSTTLQRILDNPRVYELSDDVWLKMAVKLCNVLQAIHDSGIIHADLKSENVIIDNNYQPVIIDFGRSCLDSCARYEQTILDPEKYDWIAPEVCFRVEPHSFESDIFSLGTLLLDINNQARVNSDKLSSAAHLCHHRAKFRPKIAKVRNQITKNNQRLMCQVRKCRFSTV
ncbi:uncharacterized protein [Antedon mediterranea]|uniref:uncharacterized protein n=1 Tax=Antedon mediterranea TaxID=105859 RepID=UPI003AF88049